MSVLDLVKEAGAVLSAVLVILGVLAWLLNKIIKPRVVAWFRREVLHPVQETHRSVTINGHHSETPTLRDQVDTLTRRAAANAAAIEEVRRLAVVAELTDHGKKSRAAMAVYRVALADQGIHLPAAPGEDGHTTPTTPTEGKHRR